MKLIIDLIGFEHGKAYGFEEFIFNILHTFSERRETIKVDEIIVACYDNQKDYIFSRIPYGIDVVTFKYSGFINRLLLSRKLPYYLNLSSDDIVFYPGNTMPLKKPITKTLLVVHDLLSYHPAFCSKTLHFQLYRLHKFIYIPRSIKNADTVVAISQYTKDEIIQRFGTEESKIRVVYNCFNFEKYGEVMGTTPYIEGKYILTVCSSAKHKNHQILLRAFCEIGHSFSDLKFVIVGGLSKEAESFYNDIPSSIRKRIVFVNNISNRDLGNIYHNALAYMSASLYEGLGMPVVEALYFGLPTFLSDIEIHREVSFNKAFYFEDNDYHQLASLVIDYLEGKSKKQSLAASSILARYSEQNTSMRYVEEINLLAQK